jgi:hypothetical protein
MNILKKLSALLYIALITGIARADQVDVLPNLPTGESAVAGGLEGYIVDIYRFSLYIGGFLALGAIVWGAIEWTTSGGNPSKLAEAKDRIMSAIYGLILLLAAYLILFTINPDLVTLKPLIAPK